MTILNKTPFPLFLTYEEVAAYLPDVPLDETLDIGGHRILPIRALAPDLGYDEIHEAIHLTERENADALRTGDGELRFEYACTQLEVILALAEEQGVRAWDVVAYIAQQVFPELTVLDSTKTPVTTLDALPRHDGVDQRSFHGMSNFPLSVAPPAWFPKGGMPNVVFSGM
ncbi:hypothetical protein [Microbacterium aurugineum]|uniref:Uncharacterized protein n=1 Tax=Microbacterium aurugineum TaxID=2851642 RepID=A0ABY4J3A9_9MICO|nr:hypothetical protein [Microbacterium aurugineum]UPL18642.1 hypothetical protein KV397_13175 [Microbacterium aurugineum]